MIIMTQSMEEFLWKFHRDKFTLILLGHTELFTKEMSEEYINWCRSDEGKKYLEGGSEYKPEHKGNILNAKECERLPTRAKNPW